VLNERTIKAADEIISARRPYDPVLWRWVLFGAWMNRFGVTA